MEVDDLIALAAHNLSIHVPQSARDRFFIILVRELARENRKVQEQAGLGQDSKLTHRLDDKDCAQIPVEFWRAYDRSEEEEMGTDRNT
jgi:hypothetical protein